MPLRDGIYNVSATDDTHRLAIAYNGDALDLAPVQECGNLANRGFFFNSNNLVAHNISDAQTFAACLADNVCLRDNADDHTIGIDDGRATNTLTGKELGHFLHAGLRVYGTYLAGHDITGNHCARSLGATEEP